MHELCLLGINESMEMRLAEAAQEGFFPADLLFAFSPAKSSFAATGQQKNLLTKAKFRRESLLKN